MKEVSRWYVGDGGVVAIPDYGLSSRHVDSRGGSIAAMDGIKLNGIEVYIESEPTYQLPSYPGQPVPLIYALGSTTTTGISRVVRV